MKVGDWIDEWEIVEKEKRGRVGRVFIVRRKGDGGTRYALKLQREGLADDEAESNVREALRLEAAHAGPARDHMPAVLARGLFQGQPYFVMEELTCIDYPIRPRDFRRFCVLACTALARLHAADILHCDITSLHLRWKNGGLAFIDFDNAHTHMEAAENTGHSIGTDPYIAPEVVKLGELTEKSDVFSLASVLLALCPPELEACFKPVLQAATSLDPGDRPTAAELAERLRTCHAPHHRFKAVAKWIGFVVAVCFTLLVSVYLYRRHVVRTTREEVIAIKAHVRAGKIHYKLQNFPDAVEHFETAARFKVFETLGTCQEEVYRKLADCYARGLGVERDLSKSRYYDRKARLR